MSKLSRAELKVLVEAIVEDRGKELNYDDFSETVGLYIENISGCEFIEPDEFEQIVRDCWKYYEQSR